MHRTRSIARRAVGLVVAISFAAALAACSGNGPLRQQVEAGGQPTAGQVAPLRSPSPGDLTAAAGAMGKHKTYAATMTVRLTAEGQSQPVMKMRMQSDEEHRLVRMTMSAMGTKHDVETITDGSTIYLSAGSKWIKAELDPAFRQAILEQYNPNQGVLASVQKMAGDLHPNGTDTTNGVPTNRWSGALDADRLLAFWKLFGMANAPSSKLADLARHLSGTMSVYLDGDNVLRRMTMDLVVSAPAHGTIEVAENFVVTDLDKPVTITVPPASDIERTIPNAKPGDLGTLMQDLQST